MPNGFKATKDKSKTRKDNLIASIKGKSTVTNKEIAELLIALLEKMEGK
jgi:hypothetical protein